MRFPFLTVLVAVSLSSAAMAEDLNPKGLRVAKLLLEEEISVSLRNGDALVSKDMALGLAGLDVATTAKAYAQAFDENELAADKQFGGKRILVDGVVKGVSKDALGNPYLSLVGNNQFIDVVARLKPEAIDPALTLKKGARVYLACKAGTKVIVASFNTCIFLEQRLSALAPERGKAVDGFLAGNEAFSDETARAVVFGYFLGSSLPDTSPCLNDASKCASEIKRVFPNKEIEKKAQEMLARLKTK